MRNSCWKFILTTFVLSRFFFFGVGIVAAAFLPKSYPGLEDFKAPEAPDFLVPWTRWDGLIYLDIADEGYEANGPERTPFFPFFPMLMRLGAALGGPTALWGVLVSLIATFCSLYFVYQIAEKHWGQKVARNAVLTFAFFPTAFFLNAVYSEALFVAFAAGSYWAAYVRRDLLLAGLWGALAAATRNSGVLLLIPLFYLWLRNRSEFGWRGLWELALVPAGLLGYMILLWYEFGDPLMFANAQTTGWGRELTNPLATLEKAWTSAAEGLKYVLDPATLFLGETAAPSLEASNTVNIIFLILFLVLMGIGFAILPPGLSVYSFLATLPAVLTPATGLPLMSLPRFLLGAFPLFFVLGYLLSYSRVALYLWLLVSASLGAAFTALFVSWRWVA
jgi:hypothetical protein